MRKIALVSLGVGAGQFSQFTKRLLSATVALYYIGKLLENAGLEVEIIDQPNIRISDEGVLEKILKFNPDMLLFSQFFSTRERLRKLIMKLKKASINPTFGVGGHDATFHSLLSPTEYQAFDLVFQGPVVNTVVNQVLNFAGKKQKTVFMNTLSEITEDPSLLPVLDHTNYLGTGFLVSSIGCYKKCVGCSFCTTPQFSPSGWRPREVSLVLQEASNLKESGKDYFFITDDNFLFDLDRGHEIIMGCSELGPKSMMIMTKPEQIVKASAKNYLSSWKNVKRVLLGLENGSAIGLVELEKHTGNIDTYLQECNDAIELLKANGIGPFIGHINFTGPKTAFPQLEKSAGFLYKLGGCDWTALTQAWRPYPGTPATNKFSREVWLENGELTYHFDDARVEKFHRYISSLRRFTDPMDNVLYSITDEIYIQNPDSNLWDQYWRIKDEWNRLTYEFFTEKLDEFKNNEEPSGKDFFLKKTSDLERKATKLTNSLIDK